MPPPMPDRSGTIAVDAAGDAVKGCRKAIRIQYTCRHPCRIGLVQLPLTLPAMPLMDAAKQFVYSTHAVTSVGRAAEPYRTCRPLTPALPLWYGYGPCACRHRILQAGSCRSFMPVHAVRLCRGCRSYMPGPRSHMPPLYRKVPEHGAYDPIDSRDGGLPDRTRHVLSRPESAL